jgi:hypothetical protein
VAELAIIGIADEVTRAGAEKLAAVVVPVLLSQTRKDRQLEEAVRHESCAALGRGLPEYQRVRDYIIRAEPARTATRKSAFSA